MRPRVTNTYTTKLAFGWHLNRLQGATPDSTGLHLADLLTSGRINRDEYIARVREFALAEVLEPPRRPLGHRSYCGTLPG